MKLKNEQRFYSALRDVFIGEPIQGKSGYVNLMNIKQQYFSQIEPYIKAKVDELIQDESAREELFEKLYTFFDSYFNETGTVFFANSQIHKNLYEHVYSDKEDVSLFWKTQKLYYVKSEPNYKDLETVIDGITFKFDASDLEHQKSNEKKELEFHLINISNDTKSLYFKVRYKKQVKYDRLKDYLSISETKEIKSYIKDNFPNISHPNIKIITNCYSVDDFSITQLVDNIQIYNQDDVLNSVNIELSICKIKNLLNYFENKSIPVHEVQLNKAFQIYKKQNEIDYFIHKDAEGFLKEQFNIYLYNYLFNEQDLKTVFNAERVTQVQNIKTIAYNIIDYVSKFEEELKAIWNKPKFVRNVNYVITLDRITDESLLQKIEDHPNFNFQKSEWQELGINENSNYLPIDTKYFKDIEYEILNAFDHLDNSIDGVLIKSESYQALSSILNKYKGIIQTIYIDPPFNLGADPDYDYKVNYKDSTWLTLLDNRIEIAKMLLRKQGNFFLRCDYNGNYLIRNVLNNIIGYDNYINEIIVGKTSGKKKTGSSLSYTKDYLFFYSKSSEAILNETEKNTSLYEFYSRILKSLKRNHFISIKQFQNIIENEIFWVDLDHRPGERLTNKNRTILNIDFPPPSGRHWIKSQNKLNTLYEKGFARLKDKVSGKIFTKEEDLIGFNLSNARLIIQIYLKDEIITDNWTDISGYAQANDFKTENSEILLYRTIQTSSNIKDWVLDFFMGSATTQAVAHKLNRKWLGVELGKHFDDKSLKRMKKVLGGIKIGVSDIVEYEGGGFFKYYELEQYEEALSIAKYNPKEGDIANINFEKDEKLLEAAEIDFEKEQAILNFKLLYPDVDIAETISNITGWKIKKLFKNKVIFDNEDRDVEIIYDEITYEKYPFLKPLIWWKSKK